MIKLYSIYLDNNDELFYIFDEENIYLDSQCEDITDKILNNDILFGIVFDAKYFKLSDTRKYYVDNKNVVLDYSKKEYDIAIWLAKKFGGKIYMLPRINNPKGIQTADYLWNGELWDLKTIIGNNISTIDRAINGKKKQANNFIIDISYSKMTTEDAIKNIKIIYSSRYRYWVNKIMLIKHNKLIKIYKRK